MIDICEIFTHWHAGRSKNEIAGSLGLSRNTVRKYVAAAEAARMVPGGPPLSQEEWGRLAREWFPELADTRLRQVIWPALRGAPRLHRRAAGGLWGSIIRSGLGRVSKVG